MDEVERGGVTGGIHRGCPGARDSSCKPEKLAYEMNNPAYKVNRGPGTLEVDPPRDPFPDLPYL